MKNYVICKVCGYVMEEGTVKDLCPACGVSAKAFEPYKSRLNPKRSKILDIHMHPIILHFPQAVVVFSLLLLALIPVTNGPLKEFVTISAKFNTYILPFCIIGGTLSGILDGKYRFRKATTPILKIKIALSCVFFVLSVAAALVLYMNPISNGIIAITGLLILLATVCAVVLGKIGSRLIGTFFPG